MPTDFDIETLIEQENSFVRANSVSCTLPIHKVVTSCREWEREGIPFVLQGVSLDTSSETPFGVSTKWLQTLFGTSDGADTIGPGIMPVSVLPCPIEWSGWLASSSKVPNCLLPHKGADEFTESVNTASCITGTSGCETYFEEGTQGTTDHYLLCVCDQETSIIWFMTSSDHANDVTEYFSSSGGLSTPRTFSLSELAEAPFKVYVYVQKRGDLVVLPPRSYRQQRFQGAGVGASMFWSRMTLRGLEFAVLYDSYRRQRMCIPARFPVKSLACQVMCSRFERLKAAGVDITVSSLSEIRKLLDIVDEILGVESHPEGDPLVTFEEHPPESLACTSCGGEIFRTAFSCEGTCSTNGDTEAPDGTKVIICPLCFVDGRNCSCNSMQPLRVREVGSIVETRDTVQDFIRGVADKFLLSAEELDPAHTHSIFMAALVLYQRSQTPESKKMCTFRPGHKVPSHQVPSSSLLKCSGCHSAKCFRHILASAHIHSSTALLIHAMDNNQVAWHRYHVDHKNDYADGYADLSQSISAWGRHNLHHRLVYFALNFKPSRFTNQSVVSGFYDTIEQDIIKPPTSSRPQSKRNAKPSGFRASSVQKIDDTSLSKGRSLRSRTSSASSLIPPQPSRFHKRALSPDQSAQDSSAQEEVRISKRPRTSRKVIVTSDNPEHPSALDETAYLASESDDVSTTQTKQLTRELQYSPAKPLMAFDPEVDMGTRAGPSSEAPRYQSTWSNLILPPKRSDAPISNDIREIIKESLRELIPQYLEGTAKAPNGPNIVNQPTAPEPRRLLGRLPDSAGFSDSDDRIPSEKSDVGRISFPGSFLVPPSQDDQSDEDVNATQPPESPEMPPVESRQFNFRLDSSLQTPTPKPRPSKASLPPTYGGRDAYGRSQPTLLRQSSRQPGSSAFSFSRGSQDSTTVHTHSVEMEGSSPTLHAAASRPLRQPPEHTQGVSKNRFSRQSVETDPLAFKTARPASNLPNPTRRANPTSSLNDGRRGTGPHLKSGNSISPEHLLYYLDVMERSIEDMEAEYGHRAH